MLRDECYQFLKNDLGKVEIVGFGSYGQVKLARNTENGEIVAIKMIHNKNAKEQIDVHHKLIHPNIIKLQNYYYQKEKNITYMVLEYASGGSLNEKIKFGYGQLSKSLIRHYFRDICEAVRYLHANNFMHRDIKTQNILITEDNHAKLCDFGFASILEYRSTLCGTFEYMAPEMIQKKPYDHKIDIWALGILLFELIQGYAPFRGDTGEEVIAEMKKSLIFSSRFEPIEIDLIKKILRVNADNRPEISKILEHPYFREEDSPTHQEKDPKAPKINREQPKTAPEGKKEGEKKFDFFHRKAQKKEDKPDKKDERPDKKDEKTEDKWKTQEKGGKVEDRLGKEENTEKKDKREGFKEFPRQEYKKEDSKREFKPYVPANLQNPPRNLIKNNTFKPAPGAFIPVSPSGFPTAPSLPSSSHQFNSSMQVGPTYQPSSFPMPSNPNASMSTLGKHFPVSGVPMAFSKPGSQGSEGRVVAPPLFSSGSLAPPVAGQQFQPYSWKKS